MGHSGWIPAQGASHLKSMCILKSKSLHCMLQKASTEHTFFCCFQLAQSLELFVPSSPSESSSQDSGMGVFDDKADGDDDGFIDDFVQEQSKKVLTFMCSFFYKT